MNKVGRLTLCASRPSTALTQTQYFKIGCPLSKLHNSVLFKASLVLFEAADKHLVLKPESSVVHFGAVIIILAVTFLVASVIAITYIVFVVF